MNSDFIAPIVAFSISLAGFILFFVCWWRRMRVAWQKPRAAKPQPLESVGELWGFVVGWLGLAILIGNNLVGDVERGAALRMIVFSLVAFGSAVFTSGVSFGRLLERLAIRRQQRLADGAAPPHGEALEG